MYIHIYIYIRNPESSRSVTKEMHKVLNPRNPSVGRRIGHPKTVPVDATCGTGRSDLSLLYLEGEDLVRGVIGTLIRVCKNRQTY